MPHREQEPEDDDSVSQGSQCHQHLQFDWTKTATAMPPSLVRESANWVTKRRSEALEDPSVLNRRQQQAVDPAQLNRQQMLANNILATHHY